MQIFQQIDEGDSFHMTKWPPHITLADVFAVELTTELLQNIQRYIDTQPLATTYIKAEGRLGTSAVWLLENPPDLYAIHISLIEILEKHGATFNTPEFTRNGFVPHITKQAGVDMKIGDKVTINIVSLIDMFPDQNWQMRKVIKRFLPESS
jgi:2'-5' RNA ligase